MAKRRQKVKLDPDQKDRQELARVQALLTQWRTKQKRAFTFVRKYEKEEKRISDRIIKRWQTG